MAPRTLVLGGGVSGLAAARILRARGQALEVWEAGPEPGGWARSEPWGEGSLEPGAQVLFRGPGSALDRLLEVLGLEVEPVSGIRWMGDPRGAHPVPAHTSRWLRSPLLPLAAKVRMAWGSVGGFHPIPGEDLATAARRRFGRAFAEDLLPALAAGLYAAPPEVLDGALLGALLGRSGGALVRPRKGMGALAAALAKDLPLRTGARARGLEAHPEGGFTVRGEGLVARADRVVVALPAPAAAELLGTLAPDSARALGEMRFLDVRFWHSRHEACPELARGWGLLAHPGREGGFLGFTLSGAPGGRLQVRSSLGGAYDLAPGEGEWAGVEARLRRWFPTLPPALEWREGRADRALPLPGPLHGARVRRAVEALPPGISWVGAGRFGGGIAGILEGVEGALR